MLIETIKIQKLTKRGTILAEGEAYNRIFCFVYRQMGL